MSARKSFATAILAATAAFAVALSVRAGGDKVAFPSEFDKATMYTMVDRADLKEHREVFVMSPSAIDAARNGGPLPSGTVIAMAHYRAQLDADGNPVKDANGRFLKGDLIGYGVMEKRTGWGSEYPPETRNGEWEYQAFTADRKVNEKAKLAACFQCHKPLPSGQDFVYTYEKMKAAAK